MKHRCLRALALVALLVAVPASEALPSRTRKAPARTTFVRASFGRDLSATGMNRIRRAGFNGVSVTPLDTRDLKTIKRKGMRAVVWLWDYNNRTCSFQRSNDFVRHHVRRLADNPAVVAYHIADEPQATQCPTAPRQLKARSDLIHSLDPGTPTMIALTIRGGGEWYPYQRFVDSADILGLVVYPCTWRYGCRFGMINTALKEAKADGVKRFWAIMQVFGKKKNWYRQPTPAQVARQFDAWGTSGMEGYMAYHWGYGELDSRPSHLSALAKQNRRRFVADDTRPTAPTRVRVRWNPPNLRISWRRSRDNVRVTGYRIYEDGEFIGSAPGRARKWTNEHEVRRPHTYTVRAGDAAGNVSRSSRPVTTKT